jgi:hypothetical protein
MPKKEIEWFKLDNHSKVFPASWNHKDSKVFRLSCELFEAVKPEFLQKALDTTIDDFPLYRYVLRKGWFWYYLESSEIRPVVSMESETLCAPIYIGLRNNLLFRVSYFNKRINLEVFHALSDGDGAVRFMRSLVYNYLSTQNDESPAAVLSGDSSSISEQMDDSYKKHYFNASDFRDLADAEKKKSKLKVYRLSGTRTSDNIITLVEGAMSTRAVLDEAHKYGVSLTVFISALFIHSIYSTMPKLKKTSPIVLSIPVNLRNYFESSTARNFFGTIDISYNFEKGDDLKSVIDSVNTDFKKNLSKDHINYQLYKYMAVERNLAARVVPLPLKDFFIRLAVNAFDRQTTSSLSNIGQIVMPPEYSVFIRHFGVCTSVRRPQITICSFNDRLLVSITSPFKEMEIQRTFFRMLSKMGVDIEVSSNV